MPTPPVEPAPGSSPSSSSSFPHLLAFANFRSNSPQGSSSARPETRASAAKRARLSGPSGADLAPSHRALPSHAPSAAVDAHDRGEAYAHVPPGAQLLDPTGMTRIQSKPRRKVGTFEAWRIWYSSLTVGSMFEQWEVIFVHSVVLGLFILLGCALAYFPPHVAHVVERARYYLSGSDL
ncbi:hypothetical protein JCM10450v2_006981 [Rhodotorula kratochvilovae]